MELQSDGALSGSSAFAEKEKKEGKRCMGASGEKAHFGVKVTPVSRLSELPNELFDVR